MRFDLLPALIGLVLLALPAAAQEAPSAPLATSIAQATPGLENGGYLWMPEASPEGPLLLVISTGSQRAILYRNGVPIAATTVSTGRPGRRTPTGVFTVLEKQIEHYSSLYDNAPMPYMQRLTWGGVALHGGTLPGYAASHGCIRLPHEFAQLLYGVTRIGTKVIITDAPALPGIAPVDNPLAGAPTIGAAPQWYPDQAPSGPVSILVSAADRRILVLRNGVVIAQAPVTLTDAVAGTQIYRLATSGFAGPSWVRVAPEAAPDLSPGTPGPWHGIRVDTLFLLALETLIEPGAHVMVTADSLVTGAAHPASTP